MFPQPDVAQIMTFFSHMLAACFSQLAQCRETMREKMGEMVGFLGLVMEVSVGRPIFLDVL